MKKDFTRDYVTEIFRVYAAAGEPTYKAAREYIYKNELLKRANREPHAAVAAAECEVNKQSPYLLDIMAAYKTMELLEHGDKEYMVDAVRAVYFAFPLQPLRRGDISNRVHRFAITYPTDERTVYRWLKEARLLCAAIRGLRVSDNSLNKYMGCQ